MRRKRPALLNGRHFEAEIIVVCVRWYLRGLSFRNVEELMVERNLSVDHVTIWRCVQRYAPEITRNYLVKLLCRIIHSVNSITAAMLESEICR